MSLKLSEFGFAAKPRCFRSYAFGCIVFSATATAVQLLFAQKKSERAAAVTSVASPRARAAAPCSRLCWRALARCMGGVDADTA